MMRSLLLLIILFTATPVARAQLYVPDAALRAEVQTCQNLWPDLAVADQCLFDLAQTKQNRLVCNYIHDNYRHLHCHQLLPRETFGAGFFLGLPLVAVFLSLILLLSFKPPRGPYVTGMLVGMLVALLWLYLRSVPFPWLQSIQPYLPYLALPADGLMRFSPTSFSYWPFAVKFVAVHVIVYGAILGTLLQGERRTFGLILFLFALLLTFWDHPLILGTRMWLQALVN